MNARAVEAALLGFIGGVGIVAGVMWAFRDRIKARMIRRQRRG